MMVPSKLLPRRLLRSLALWFAMAMVPLGRMFFLQPARTLQGHSVDDSSGRPEDPAVTVGVAITITGCSKFALTDGAAVLQHSVQRQPSRYHYQFYAIYHPSASSCVQPLTALGYTLLERESPVNVSEIEGGFLRDIISKSGCCGEKELLKFEAFRLYQHPVVVLLDADMLVTKPFDDLFDLVLHHRRPAEDHHFMWPQRELPDDIWLLYTTDYAMVGPQIKIKPSQGGFSVLKPNRTVFEEIMAIVRKGQFSGSYGWHPDSDFFYGSTTFQGLLPYYFQVVRPGHAVELNWCRHNAMAVQPRVKRKDRATNTTSEVCFTNEPECEDCRLKRLEDVYSVHYTSCQKPWICEPHSPDPPAGEGEHRLCDQMHQAWFQARSELEKSWGRSGRGNETRDPYRAQFYGHCRGYGGGAYDPIRQPYGRP